MRYNISKKANQKPDLPDALRKQLADCLVSLIQIDTRSSRCNEKQAVDYIASICEKYNIEYSIIEPCSGKASLVCKIEGRNPADDGLLLLSHIDTAEWNESDWEYHPLSGQISNNRIYGRGAIDCKSLAAIWLHILIDVVLAGSMNERDIYFVAASDEELGGGNGIKKILESTDILSKCSCAINEGGGYILSTLRGAFITCQYGEKGSVKYNLPGCIIKEQIILGNTGIYNNLNYIYKQIKQKYYNHVLEGSRVKPDFINSNFNTLSSDKYNHVHLSYLDKVTDDKVKKALVGSGTPVGRFEEISHILPSISAKRTNLYKTIKKAARRNGYKGVVPVITKGSSDSRFLRENGIDTYGFFPVGLREDVFSIHSNNEYIHEESLWESFLCLLSIVRGYCEKNC